MREGALFVAVWMMATMAFASTMADSLKFVQGSKDFVELRDSWGLKKDLRYASKNNFVGRDMYGVFNKTFLHREAADKLKKAIATLQKEKPGYKLVIFDALRPRSVQFVLWNQVKGTPEQKYVADPEKGSVHNYGFAVDLSVVDDKGHELDMGTPYDDFTEVAHPAKEAEMLKVGRLTQTQLDNRLLLRRAMEGAGFRQLSFEWWHYDGRPLEELRAGYRIVE